MPFSDSSHQRRGSRSTATDGHQGASSSSSTSRDPRRPIKAALDPIASDSAPSSMAVLGHAVKTFGNTWTGRGPPGGSSNELLTDVAPLLLTPRLLQSATQSRNAPALASSSALALGHGYMPPIRFPAGVLNRRTTSTSLRILEVAPSLLSIPVPDAEPASSGNVSLLRGFQATVPSADTGKERRRKVRGSLADSGIGGSVGVKKIAAKEGVVDGTAEDEEEGEILNPKERRRRRRETAAHNHGTKGRDIGAEELARMQDEIKWDRENLVVRKSLLSHEIEEVSGKIAALEIIRSKLEQGILKLREEDLELVEEADDVQERLSRVALNGVPSLLDQRASKPSSNRRRKGPAFLPSEHDDLPPGVAFMTLANHTGRITALDFTEPYGTLVSAATDDSVRVWDLCSGEEVGRLRGHKGAVKTIQTDEQLCLTAGADGDIRLWDLRLVDDYEDRLAAAMEASTRFVGKAAHGESDAADAGDDEDDELPDLDTLAKGAGIRREDGEGLVEGGPCVKTLEGHSKAVSSLYYEDGCLVTGSSDKTIRQWDVNTGQCVLTMDILWAISNAPPSSPSASASNAFSLSDPYGASTPGGVFSGHSLLSAVTSNEFRVPTPPYEDGSWEMYDDFVGGVQFWGYALASGSGDGGVRMWDMRTGQAHRTLVGHTGPVTCLQFDEQNIITGSLDKTIRIWDLRTGLPSETLSFDFPVTALQFDSRKIVACAGENGWKVWNRTTREMKSLTTGGHSSPVEKGRYDGRYGASGAKDGVVKIWSL